MTNTKTTKALGIGLLALLYVLMVGACKTSTTAFVLPWAESSPQIDGDLAEWQSPLEQTSQQYNIKYRCSNNREFLYLVVHIPDEYVRSLMLTQGATIWLDTTAKHREKIGIGYPIPLNKGQMAEVEKEAKGDPQLYLKAYAYAHQEFDLIGFVEEPVRASNISSKDLKVAMGFDNLRAMVLELKIPIKQILGRAPKNGDIWSMGIKVNEPKKTVDDDNTDNSLFNDPTQSGVTQTNPLLGNNPNQRQQFAAPTRNPTMPAVWSRIQLTVEG